MVAHLERLEQLEQRSVWAQLGLEIISSFQRTPILKKGDIKDVNSVDNQVLGPKKLDIFDIRKRLNSHFFTLNHGIYYAVVVKFEQLMTLYELNVNK